MGLKKFYTFLSSVPLSNMSKTLVRVFTQYYNENGKPKGGQEFEFRADSDFFMYMKDEAIQAIKNLLLNFEKDSNYAGRHEYIAHELIFHEAIQLDSEKFQAEYEIEVMKNNKKTEG